MIVFFVFTLHESIITLITTKSISNLDNQLQGGKAQDTSTGIPCFNYTEQVAYVTPTIFNSCTDVCATGLCETQLTCLSWWGGELCN